MKTKLLIAGLALAILAIPAAVPASQLADIRIADPAATVVAVTDPALPGTLLVNPKRHAELSIQLPSGFTTLEWIDTDPFAN